MGFEIKIKEKKQKLKKKVWDWIEKWKKIKEILLIWDLNLKIKKPASLGFKILIKKIKKQKEIKTASLRFRIKNEKK